MKNSAYIFTNILLSLALAMSLFYRKQNNPRGLRKKPEKNIPLKHEFIGETSKTLFLNESNFSESVINSIPGIFFIIDQTGKIYQFNRFFVRFTGLSETEPFPDTIINFVAPESIDKFSKTVNQLWLDHNQVEVELHLVGEHNQKTPFNCSFSSFTSCNKSYLIGIGIDISQRIQAEEEHQQSEERLRLAAEATELGTWYLDLLTRSFKWSDRCYAIFGLKPGTPMSYDIFISCLHPDDRERTNQAVMAALDPINTSTYDIEYRSIWPADGSIHWISAKGRGHFEVVNGSLQATRMNGTTLDITPRVLAVEALRESERKYRSLFLVEPDALILIDKETMRILEANESALLLYGYDRETFLSLNTLNISAIPDETRKLFFSSDLDLEYVVESYHKKKDGLVFPVEVSRCAFELCGRRVIYFAIRDITERKRMETELEQAHKELEDRVEQRTAEITTVNLRLHQEIVEHKETEKELQEHQQKLLDLSAEVSLAEERERRRIASELHDDIGQTLALCRIKIESALLSSPPIPIEQPILDARDMIISSIQKVRSLTSQLSPPLLYEVGFSAAMRWLADKLQQESGLHIEILGGTVRKELSEEVAVTLFQVVRELLVNISKHAKAHSTEIMINTTKTHIMISVKDDGIGFDVERIGKKDEFGLFNIRQKMNHLGGEISIHSETGKGTRISLKAPF